MSKCEDCDGLGFKEYDAGLLSIYCKTCEGVGKVDEALTKEEFESAYAFRSDMTVDQVRELGLEAVPSGECVRGWAMQQIVVTEPEKVLTHEDLQKAATIPSPLPMTMKDLEDLSNNSYISDEAVDSIELPEEPSPTPAINLKKGLYYCGKCEKAHTEKSKIGKKHLKYKTEVMNESDTSGNRPTGGDTGSGNPGESSEPEQPEDETGTGADSSYLLQENW